MGRANVGPKRFECQRHFCFQHCDVTRDRRSSFVPTNAAQVLSPIRALIVAPISFIGMTSALLVIQDQSENHRTTIAKRLPATADLLLTIRDLSTIGLVDWAHLSLGSGTNRPRCKSQPCFRMPNSEPKHLHAD
jgi:hypothetical protein